MIDSPTGTLSGVDAKTLSDTMANAEVLPLVERQLAVHWVTWRPRHWLTR